MKSELEAGRDRKRERERERERDDVRDGRKSVGPRFRQNNYRGSQRVRVRTVAAVIALPSIPPSWPTFSYVRQAAPPRRD